MIKPSKILKDGNVRALFEAEHGELPEVPKPDKTKAQSRYRKLTNKEIEKETERDCANCVNFIPGEDDANEGMCKIVQGRVRVGFVCKFFKSFKLPVEPEKDKTPKAEVPTGEEWTDCYGRLVTDDELDVIWKHKAPGYKISREAWIDKHFEQVAEGYQRKVAEEIEKVSITFSLNDLALGEASIVLFDPFNVTGRGKKDTGGRLVDTHGSEAGYVLPPSAAYALAKEVIAEMSFLRYSRRNLLTFRTLLNTTREFSFVLESNLPRLALVFKELWEDYIDDRE